MTTTRRTRTANAAVTATAPRQRVRSRIVEVPDADKVYAGLDGVMGQVHGRMGPHVMRKGSALQGFYHVETGVFMLDLALLGGIPEGLVTQVYGWEASGKTTICMRTCARAQAKHPTKAVVYIDAEHTFDPVWAAHHGIDVDRLYVVQPESGEQAVDILDAVLRSPETAVVILDSLPALVPQAEIDSSAEDSLVAKRSQLIGRACSKILSATQAARAQGNNPTTIFINQFRMKIGVAHGDPRTLPGGMQPKYLASTMIEVKKKKENMGKDEYDMPIVEYNEHGFAIKKSKVGNSLRDGEFIMICDPNHPLGQGAIDEGRQVVTYAKRMGIVSGGGASWYVDGINQKFGKMDDIVKYLEQDDFEFTMLKARIVATRRKEMGLLTVPVDGYLMGISREELAERMEL